MFNPKNSKSIEKQIKIRNRWYTKTNRFQAFREGEFSIIKPSVVDVAVFLDEYISLGIKIRKCGAKQYFDPESIMSLNYN